MKKKILVVEDEANVASLINRSLTEESFDVSLAMEGTTGLQMAQDFDFDLIILDMMLPGMDGLSICNQLRNLDIRTPIMMLTALGSTENIVSGLNMGADDYVVKPFNLPELIARIRALLRRNISTEATATVNDNIIIFADLSINTSAKMVQRSGKELSLTATEYRLLTYLLQNKNRVLSRMDILENVWDVNFNLGTNVVDVYVNYLRKKVDKDFEPKLIHTVIGMGYVLKIENEVPK